MLFLQQGARHWPWLWVREIIVYFGNAPQLKEEGTYHGILKVFLVSFLPEVIRLGDVITKTNRRA